MHFIEQKASRPQPPETVVEIGETVCSHNVLIFLSSRTYTRLTELERISKHLNGIFFKVCLKTTLKYAS